ncbi:hypothetical protein [Desulfovibrio sp. Fe33]|uniref:hypothetical protein n=1 Tax=Desulfovibrio sp. Fe33 TaxID=3020842 RepID=UPI00234E0BE4|nr:hypothetical protein [Desulfovibrio sp. Fe33]
MSKAEFTIFYDGEALRGSKMEVRDLAPALLAVGELLERANAVLNGDELTVKVNIKAFEAGCFGISFEVVQSFTSQVASFFSPGSDVREALEILGLIGIAPLGLAGGLWGLLKKARGRKATRIKSIPNNMAEITFDQQGQIETIKVNGDVASLFANAAVRKAVDRVVEPLRTEGIDSLCLGTQNEQIPLAEKKTVDYFNPPDIEPVLLNAGEPPQDRFFSIVSLSFKEDNKWRLTDGSTPISVKITDKNFLKDVDENRINFAKGDTLKVRLKTIQMQTADGLKTEYEASKILDHIKRDRQAYLPVE